MYYGIQDYTNPNFLFAEQHILDECAAYYGLSSTYSQKIKKRALKKLSHLLYVYGKHKIINTVCNQDFPKLTPQEDFILRMRFGIQKIDSYNSLFETGHFLDEIAEATDIQVSNVCAILQCALEKLKFSSKEELSDILNNSKRNLLLIRTPK